jgi:RNA polymerase-binding transcription factor
MSDKTAGLDKAFLERQRAKLLKLQAELKSAVGAEQAEEIGTQRQSLGEAQEQEDDAQRLDALDTGQLLRDRNTERLRVIGRALEKITDGTYGLSDGNGKPIPRDRLEAVPEAIHTVEEQARP